MTIQSTIESYRKRRQQLLPLIIGVAAVLLVIIGMIVIIASIKGGSSFNPFARSTPHFYHTAAFGNTHHQLGPDRYDFSDTLGYLAVYHPRE